MLANVADDTDCTQLRFSVRLRLALTHCWWSLPCRSIQSGFVGLVKLCTFVENMFHGVIPRFPLDGLLVPLAGSIVRDMFRVFPKFQV